MRHAAFLKIDIRQENPSPINIPMVRYDDINCACRPEYFQAHSYIIMSLLSDGGDLTPINRND